MQKADDGFSFEGDRGNLAINEAGDGFFAERNEDDVARFEIEVRRIS